MNPTIEGDPGDRELGDHVFYACPTCGDIVDQETGECPTCAAAHEEYLDSLERWEDRNYREDDSTP